MALQTLEKVVGRPKSTWDDILYDQGFPKIGFPDPSFTAYIVLTFITWGYKYVLRRLVDIWLIIVTLFIITSLLNTINKICRAIRFRKIVRLLLSS